MSDLLLRMEMYKRWTCLNPKLSLSSSFLSFDVILRVLNLENCITAEMPTFPIWIYVLLVKGIKPEAESVLLLLNS